MKNQPTLLHKYRNIGYALVVFFYIDLAAWAVICCTGCTVDDVREAARTILDTPDLTSNTINSTDVSK